MPNRLTPLYSEIYYKEENYLKVRTVVFKYITPPHSKGWVCWYISILVYLIPTFLYFHILNSHYILLIWLSYPSSYNFTGSISPAFYTLILTQYKSSFSIYTILFIKSIIPTLFSIFLFLKNLIFKLLIRDMLYPSLI